jgi:hypothetical protein
MDDLMKLIEQALFRAARMDIEFQSNGRRWVLSMKPVDKEEDYHEVSH